MESAYPPASRVKPRAVEKPRILVVAEDRRVLEETATILGATCTVLTVSSARRALDLAEHEPFHVVCADDALTGMSTPELFRRLLGPLGHVGYLMLTTPAAYAHGQADGRWHVVFKPVDPRKLGTAVAQLSRLAQMRRSVAELGQLKVARR